MPTNNNNILRGRVFALVLCVFSGVLSSHVVDNVFEGGGLRVRERTTDGLTQTNDTGDDDEARTDSDKSELGDGRSVGLVWSPGLVGFGLFCWLCTTSCVAVLVICSLIHGSMMVMMLMILAGWLAGMDVRPCKYQRYTSDDVETNKDETRNQFTMTKHTTRGC